MATKQPGKYAPKRTPELENAILQTISTQRIGTAEACQIHGITREAFYKWLDDDDSLVDRYARAKEAQHELMAQEILSIADDREEDANSRRVRVDSRKWLLSKLMPKKYGDRLDLNAQIEVAPLVALNSRKRLVSDG